MTSMVFGCNLRGVGVVGGQRVPVGDEEIALVLVLQLDPVVQRAHVVAQVQLAGGAHAAQNARAGIRMSADSAILRVDSGIVPRTDRCR